MEFYIPKINTVFLCNILHVFISSIFFYIYKLELNIPSAFIRVFFLLTRWIFLYTNIAFDVKGKLYTKLIFYTQLLKVTIRQELLLVNRIIKSNTWTQICLFKLITFRGAATIQNHYFLVDQKTERISRKCKK